MKTEWQQEGTKMRLYVDGHPSPMVIELDGERWKTSRGAYAAWFSSLKDARLSAERSARFQTHLDVLAGI